MTIHTGFYGCFDFELDRPAQAMSTHFKSPKTLLQGKHKVKMDASAIPSELLEHPT
jgi:hypothetical protein